MLKQNGIFEKLNEETQVVTTSFHKIMSLEYALQESFSINDFEKISGVKAHTIRMW